MKEKLEKLENERIAIELKRKEIGVGFY